MCYRERCLKISPTVFPNFLTAIFRKRPDYKKVISIQSSKFIFHLLSKTYIPFIFRYSNEIGTHIEIATTEVSVYHKQYACCYFKY